MPRDGSGVYTLPSGNPVVSGTVIASAWANTTLSDIAAQLNNVFTRDGLLGPTGPFKVVDGTVAAPGLAWNSEPGLGWYRAGAGQRYFAYGGMRVEALNVSDPALTTFVLNPRQAAGDSQIILRNSVASDPTNYSALEFKSAASGNASITTRNAGTGIVGDIYYGAKIHHFTAAPAPATGALAQIGIEASAGVNGHAVLELRKGSMAGPVAQIAGMTLGSMRWTIQMPNGESESGGNVGSNFAIARYSDAGALLDTPFFINRATASISMIGTVFIGTGGQVGSIQLSAPATNGKDILGISGGLARWNLRIGSGTGDGGDDFVVYRYNDAGVVQGQAMRIVRSTGNVAFASIIQAGQNGNGFLAGGGTASELAISPSSSTNGPIAWPNTNGGYVSVRGNAQTNYGSGAVTCYSGSGNTGVTLTNGSGAWSALSDIREKNVVSEVEDGLDAVLAMRPIRYRYIFEDDSARLRVGLSAQSVQTYVPEAVAELPKLGEDGQPTEETRLNLAITEVIPAMVNAIKTLHERITYLERL